ncbi:ABC transporter substrate-binding protein [Actinomadura gamaensis]|uniref:ABC transporter substrate-binding protein n=1 Tax=Actinomadura gamaensis TaxID=1763541 RepID=A0ABV9TW55_9ACTN
MTTHIPRRSFLGALGLGAAALALPGCSSAVDQASSGKGGRKVLTIVQGADIAPATLFGQNNPNFSINRTVFNTLTEYDHRTLQPKPGLAESWQVKGDAVTLKLRSDVTFHTGRPFTADDVVFALENLRKPEVASQLKHVAQAVAKTEKNGDHELTITFAHPVGNVFDLFEIMIIPDRETIGELAAGTKIIGTGPFKVDSYTPGTGVTLSRNPKYFKPVKLDGVEIKVIGQSQSMVAALRSGQAHLALDLAPLDAAGLKGDRGFQVVVSDANDSAFYVGSNVTVKPLDDKRVRQAVAYAVDRDRILSQVLGGIGRTSSLPWAPSSPAYDAAKAKTYSYDTAKAKELLGRAGAAGAKIDLFYNAGLGTNAKIAEIVQFNLKEAGLNVSAVPLQAPDFQAKLTGGGIGGLFVNGHGFGQLNPATLVKGAFPFNAEKNSSKFSDGTYTSLADELWRKPGASVYGKVNDFLLDQQFVSDLVGSAHTFTISTKVRGLAYTMFDYLNLDDADLA